MNRTSMILGTVFAAILLVAICAAGWLLFSGPTVEIANVEYPPLKFRLQTTKIRGLLGVSFYSSTDEEYLWNFSVDNRPVDLIEYGVLPAGGKQSVPKEGRPRPLKVGEKVFVVVSYQYDTFMAACGSTKTWALTIESETKAKLLGEFSSTILPPLVQVVIKKVEYPPLKISFKNSNITSFRSICLYSDTAKEYVWIVDVDTVPIEEITYGVILRRATRWHLQRASRVH
jgi:hypothetical protein